MNHKHKAALGVAAILATAGFGVLGTSAAANAVSATTDTAVSWLIPAGYSGHGAVPYPQTLYSTPTCGDQYVQTDRYHGTQAEIIAITADGLLTKNEDRAVYISHVITKQEPCVSASPTATPSPSVTATATPIASPEPSSSPTLLPQPTPTYLPAEVPTSQPTPSSSATATAGAVSTPDSGTPGSGSDSTDALAYTGPSEIPTYIGWGLIAAGAATYGLLLFKRRKAE